jgi:3-methyladenine DNA glycosylase AlkD
LNKSQLRGTTAIAREIQARVEALPALKTQAIRAIRREFSKRLANEEPDFVMKLALQLLALPSFTFRFIAYELVQHHPATASSLDVTDLERLGNGMDSWGSVDCFACYLAGPAWRERQIADSVVRRWSRSKNRWWRRAALVATVPLNNKTRGGTGDSRRTLEICGLLMDDRDPMVVKALSWALRELAKRDKSSVREFLENAGDKLPAQALREVRNKLATGLKNPLSAQKL